MVAFHPAVQHWFHGQVGTPTAVQQEAWRSIAAGRHSLIAAPTGSGKTLAAFLWALDTLLKQHLAGQLENTLQVLYISPLKALGNDIQKNLHLPQKGIAESLGADFPLRIAVRSGDTPPKERRALLTHPPHVLVTTPESFYLLLTSESGRALLAPVRTVIVDEIHALAPNRRGAHLSLSLERLESLAEQSIVRIGLSATQKPLERIARYLVGNRPDPCAVVDGGHVRRWDLGVEVPSAPLSAVMSNEVWEELYDRMAELINGHRTTLIFVNTRRLAERVTHHLAQRLGDQAVTAHHGSLSAQARLDAEQRLKSGDLRALVATASLELGIDIGSVDLVCQVGSPRSIATLLQRVGRAGHWHGGVPKGRIFPLSRDELVECTAAMAAAQAGEMDILTISEAPLDVLAQQIVAEVACGERGCEALYATYQRAYPYRALSRQQFDDVVGMLASGFATQRGRRSAHVHYDGVQHTLRPRKHSRLVALTCGGAIPDNADYRVLLEPSGTFVGTLNEDFAIESMAGDIFQLGNNSWRILRVEQGVVRVEDAKGLPPTIPFWLGEAPARTDVLSQKVSQTRRDILESSSEALGLADAAFSQLYTYMQAARSALTVLPGHDTIIAERFFDASGGMQLVIHSTYGARVNRAFGLALRKRFCRSFNFELQAAATEDAVILSLGEQHSFPLEDVFKMLNSRTVRDVLVQALLDAPMFAVRWRWNVGRALAVLRQRGGKRTPAPLFRMQAEDLVAAVFPEQLACLENIAGDRQIPEHPLVQQTIDDCLHEVMDIDGLVALLEGIETGRIRTNARDLPEPSPLAHEILNAKPYAFLDDAPLEERRTQAVMVRQSLEAWGGNDAGRLDPMAIAQVCDELTLLPRDADEAHDALMLAGVMSTEEIHRAQDADWQRWLDELAHRGQACVLHTRPGPFLWVALERLSRARAVWPHAEVKPELRPPFPYNKTEETEAAVQAILASRMELCGPITAAKLAETLALQVPQVEAALLRLEASGVVMRGRFTPDASAVEWCNRRILARIHKLTLQRLRAEIEPVSTQDFLRFLADWQHVEHTSTLQGPAALDAVLLQLQGYEAPAAAWESSLLAARIRDYTPRWLDEGCLSGRYAWGRMGAPSGGDGKRSPGMMRHSLIAILPRASYAFWRRHGAVERSPSSQALRVLETLQQHGASFLHDLLNTTGLLQTQLEESLGELASLGLVTSDAFAGLRALLIPASRRRNPRHRRRMHVGLPSGLESAGRWSLLPAGEASLEDRAVHQARALLRRYGVVFYSLIRRESNALPWRDVVGVLRRLEARGEIRGGRFVQGQSGEQFALPEVIPQLRKVRRQQPTGHSLLISAADPLNLFGVLTPGSKVPALEKNYLLVREGVLEEVVDRGRLRSMAGSHALLPTRPALA